MDSIKPKHDMADIEKNGLKESSDYLQKKHPDNQDKEAFDLESELKKLELMVGRLEDGNISLDEAFKVFEKGSYLSEKINKHIKSYERKLQVLNEQYKLEDFNEDDLTNTNKGKN